MGRMLRVDKEEVLVTGGLGYRVLVIDDEPAMGRVVRRYLEPRHRVTFEDKPDLALTRLLEGEVFEVILCDVIMPLLPGPALLTELQLARPDQASRLIFMTGGARNSGAVALLDTMPNRRLDKPFSLRLLELELELVAQKAPSSVLRGEGSWA